MTDKWFSKLTKDVGQAVSDMPSPTESIIPMPSPSLNYVVGNGGLTKGKAACFFGPESSGKSLLAQLTAIAMLKDNPGSYFIWFDAEFSFNRDWFKKLSGFSEEEMSRVIVRQTNEPIEIFDYIYGDMNDLVEQGCPIVGIAIDSVKSIRYPKDIKDKSTKMVMGGGGASYLGSALKSVLPVIRRHNITTLLVQQVYEEMDEYKKMLNPWIVPDGRALKHFCDYMLEVQRIDSKKGRLEDGKDMNGSAQQVGHKVRVRGKKNRLGAPYRTGIFSLNYTQGIVDVETEVFELAKSLGVVYHPINPDTGKINNQMWQFADIKVRGEANMLTEIKNNPTIVNDIIEACNKIDDEDLIAASSETLSAGAVDFNIEELEGL